MKKFAIVFLMVVAWAGMAYGQDTTKTSWSEFDISAFERIDGHFGPEPSISVLNYIQNKGIGLYVGRDRSAGPLLSWRVWWGNPYWFKELRIAFHVLASSDLVQTEPGDRVFDNGTSGLDVRIELAKGMEVSGKILWTFADGEKTQFTPALGIVLRPL